MSRKLSMVVKKGVIGVKQELKLKVRKEVKKLCNKKTSEGGVRSWEGGVKKYTEGEMQELKQRARKEVKKSGTTGLRVQEDESRLVSG